MKHELKRNCPYTL